MSRSQSCLNESDATAEANVLEVCVCDLQSEVEDRHLPWASAHVQRYTSYDRRLIAHSNCGSSEPDHGGGWPSLAVVIKPVSVSHLVKLTLKIIQL